MRWGLLPAVTTGLLLAAGAGHGAEQGLPGGLFRTRLTVAAADAVQSRNLRGDGQVQLRLEGDVAIVSGEFSGLVSAATRARVFQGPVAGVPGTPLMELDIPKARSGTISARLTLSPAQLQALRAWRWYVQIDSELAPEGTLWGWLMPGREPAVQRVPEQQPGVPDVPWP